ncbi:MAG TPA: hypothetical protein DEQ02_06885 [Ruminococcaceae bacterium]|nr:hypothetical protein [Oscillospiraceae bacterium]
MQELTDNSFEEALRHGKLLLMFYTDWCPMCPLITDMLNDLERKEGGKFIFARINHDDNPRAADTYGAFGVPIVIAFIEGTPIYGCAGILIPEVYRMIVEELLYSFNEKALKEKLERIEAFIDSCINKDL